MSQAIAPRLRSLLLLCLLPPSLSGASATTRAASEPQPLPRGWCPCLGPAQVRRPPHASSCVSPSQALLNIIKPPVQDPRSFLQQHIRNDLQQLARTLGKTADETVTVVHLVLCSLLPGQHHRFEWSEHKGRGWGGGAEGADAESDKGKPGEAGRREHRWMAQLAFPYRVKTRDPCAVVCTVVLPVRALGRLCTCTSRPGVQCPCCTRDVYGPGRALCASSPSRDQRLVICWDLSSLDPWLVCGSFCFS